ncbi:MAG: hypothetical protein AAB358_01655 [Patescibacteria group bacterium]
MYKLLFLILLTAIILSAILTILIAIIARVVIYFADQLAGENLLEKEENEPTRKGGIPS